MAFGKPVRILILEDNAGQSRLARRMLERAGYAVAVASNGDAGLALYETSVSASALPWGCTRQGGGH